MDLQRLLDDDFIKICVKSKYSKLVLKAYRNNDLRNLKEDELYTGRPGIFQNPYPIIGEDNEQNRIICIRKYINYFIKQQDLLKDVRRTKDMKYICWCDPRICHGHYHSRVANMSICTTVGSRETPLPILKLMQELASILEEHDYLLRSGGATGADTAFFNGVKDKKNIRVYIPFPNFNGFDKEHYIPIVDEAFAIASTYHGNFNNCSDAARKLHARNVYQVLGDDLNTPSDFLICWTEDGCTSHSTRTIKTGGTGTAISVADRHANIPIFNLRNKEDIHRLIVYIGLNYKETIDRLTTAVFS